MEVEGGGLPKPPDPLSALLPKNDPPRAESPPVGVNVEVPKVEPPRPPVPAPKIDELNGLEPEKRPVLVPLAKGSADVRLPLLPIDSVDGLLPPSVLDRPHSGAPPSEPLPAAEPALLLPGRLPPAAMDAARRALSLSNDERSS